MGNKLLIVIDAQEDFTRGALRNEEAIKALPVVHDVVEYAYSNGMEIVYTRDTHSKEEYLKTQEGVNLPVEHCIFKTAGWDICPEAMCSGMVYPEIINKNSFGTLEWRWIPYRNIDEIWICGFCTDICVSANFQIIKAFCPEIPITIISDACAGVTPELHKAALDVMKSCQAKIKTWKELKEGENNET